MAALGSALLWLLSRSRNRKVARAVKNAREMALIPYTNRVTTQRRERRSDDRAPRADGPPPRPTAPPPGQGGELSDDFDPSEVDTPLGSVDVVDADQAGEPVAAGGDG